MNKYSNKTHEMCSLLRSVVDGGENSGAIYSTVEKHTSDEFDKIFALKCNLVLIGSKI